MDEAEELNNTVVKPVHVFLPPDLVISAITFDPENPESTDDVVIQTTVRNDGEVAAGNVTLQIWDGDPLGSVGDIAVPFLGSPYVIANIAPGSQFTLNLSVGNYFDEDGAYLVCAQADVEDTIRETDEFNNGGCSTLFVGVQCELTALAADLNLLAVPLQPEVVQTSSTMLSTIPNCVEVDGWDRIGQRWTSLVSDGGGQAIGDDFDIDLRDGFFARVLGPGDATFCGVTVTEHGCTALEAGLNMISVPNADACYTAFSLIDAIAGGVEAYSWDAALQSWVTAVKLGEGEFAGTDFSVTPGNGYFVNTTTGGDWCSSPCDTATVAVDLRVTPADIWITTNPVSVGELVGIYVNIDNIGTGHRVLAAPGHLGRGSRCGRNAAPGGQPPGGHSRRRVERLLGQRVHVRHTGNDRHLRHRRLPRRDPRAGRDQQQRIQSASGRRKRDVPSGDAIGLGHQQWQQWRPCHGLQSSATACPTGNGTKEPRPRWAGGIR